jgi:hypothetical protein
MWCIGVENILHANHDMNATKKVLKLEGNVQKHEI